MTEHAGTPLTIHAVTPQLQRKVEVKSAAFGEGQSIPPEFARDGDDVSPALSWEAVDEVNFWTLICEDPDAPRETPWVHWMIANIPGKRTNLPQGVEKIAHVEAVGQATQGRNDYGDIGWGGPQPPAGHGVHHYHFQLFGTSERLPFKPDTTLQEALQALKGLTLVSGELVGTYEIPG